MYCVVLKGYNNIIDCFLEWGGNIYEIDSEGWNFFYYVCRGGYEKVIEWLKMLGM